MSGIQNLTGLFPVPLKAANNLADVANLATARANLGAAAASDMNIAQQNLLYQGLLIAALRGVPTGLVDGVLDPFSSTADVNTSKSSGYTFNSTLGTIGATLDQTKALLHFDGVNGSTTFTDAASPSRTFTLSGSPAIWTAQSVFGGSSLHLNGSSYLSTAASADFGVGTGDFSVELRWRPDSIGAQMILFDTRVGGNGTGFVMYMDGSGKLVAFDGAANTPVLTGATSLVAATWYAVQLSRKNGTFYLFVNGALDGSVANATDHGSSQPLTIGTTSAGAGPATGYIDEFRFTKGLARNSAAYTPAASAFTLSASAMVLQSATLASAVASPSAMRALIQVDGTSATLTANTDMLAFLSRDGGTTWTQGTLSLVQSMPDGTAVYDTGWTDVTAQPAGNSTMTYKITTPTQKAIVLTGVSMQVRP